MIVSLETHSKHTPEEQSLAKEAAPKTIYLKDYRPPAWRTEETHLEFDIREGTTEVRSRLRVRRDREAGDAVPLVLDGAELEFVSVAVDGRPLSGNEYRVDDHSLELFSLPASCEVSIVNRIVPEENTACEGLYRSGSMYCTQCEAEGFRKITYYQDRPDILSRFTTTIIADSERFPVLLSNGNLVEESEADGRRRVTWQDPFPKPSYLFALVAGDLALMTDAFTTASGREVELRIYSESHNIGQCEYAMGALQRAMRWDEERFGREYDLDIYMIVAVEDFNMGAMENKGLNVFNTSCVLASPDTAVDEAYLRVEAVIAHEYFHNWSGNRVTCRDWFQLSLKEGFTVFRDAEFTADMHSRTVKRIEDVSDLRSRQFAEDSGPMAHPVRPDSYMEISNFYTSTVYEKGAEVVGMIRTLVGEEGFRKGTDLYFERHDGQAVTTEDFVVAIEEANGIDLAQFRRWYSQAGTPVLRVATEWGEGTLALTIEQSCPATPGQPVKEPFHIPLLVGLVGEGGEEQVDERIEVQSDADWERRGSGLLVHVREGTTTVSLCGLPSEPLLSLLRGFSAPVRLDCARPAAVLAELARNDRDGFGRWDALQSLLEDELSAIRAGAPVSGLLLDLFAGLLEEAVPAGDPEHKLMLNAMLTLPSEEYLFESAKTVDVEGVCSSRDALKAALARELRDDWLRLYEANAPAGPHVADDAGMARRGARNLALGYLVFGPRGIGPRSPQPAPRDRGQPHRPPGGTQGDYRQRDASGQGRVAGGIPRALAARSPGGGPMVAGAGDQPAERCRGHRGTGETPRLRCQEPEQGAFAVWRLQPAQQPEFSRRRRLGLQLPGTADHRARCRESAACRPPADAAHALAEVRCRAAGADEGGAWRHSRRSRRAARSLQGCIRGGEQEPGRSGVRLTGTGRSRNSVRVQFR